MTDKKTHHGHTMLLGETRSGKTTSHSKLLAEMKQGGANGHTVAYAPTRAGMSGQYDAFRLTQAEAAQISGKAK